MRKMLKNIKNKIKYIKKYKKTLIILGFIIILYVLDEYDKKLETENRLLELQSNPLEQYVLSLEEVQKAKMLKKDLIGQKAAIKFNIQPKEKRKNLLFYIKAEDDRDYKLLKRIQKTSESSDYGVFIFVGNANNRLLTSNGLQALGKHEIKEQEMLILNKYEIKQDTSLFIIDEIGNEIDYSEFWHKIL